ncbi:DNA recombination protein RmuC [Stenotrophomonas sp. 278]|uniref:DNA recombination protein RmuC n=1 Tax=Stenotrophomonas sp. 278 TaxID=2479851 RepID=UPI000F68CDE3|nr:DNA recombination protein RmuC [Stenotrophomonas sp. 278]RRU14954.1 DNA recombination protein RmuC [Stenotrophomonas sp. 278]
MQPEFLILGGLLCAVLVLQLATLLRRSRHDGLEQSLREEARIGRSELREQLEGLGRQQDARLESFARALTDLSTRTDQRLDLLRDALNDDARKAREESTGAQQRLGDSLGQRLQDLIQRNEQRIGEMRGTLEQQLQTLQRDNAEKLDQMRVTVDEKLQSTLEARLGASFQLVSDRLEQVQRGLGEMQQLATGVGDLKRVLTNVKHRGGWGEVQLEAILEQTLTQDQYARGVKVRPDSGEMVDIAVRLPGRSPDDVPVWLPIDSKFPSEDYERLLDAQEQGDVEGVRQQGAQLERAIRVQAKSISDKYIVPPHTTDFAVMFLPTEGLYAEVIRRPGLVDLLQREHRVVVAGPTTVTALLNSLQMGFRTLAIEQRSSEVWVLLGAVKSEFGKFAGILEKAEKQISTVGRSLGEASRKTRTIERRLRGVESLGGEQTRQLLGDIGLDGGDEEDPDSDTE